MDSILHNAYPGLSFISELCDDYEFLFWTATWIRGQTGDRWSHVVKRTPYIAIFFDTMEHTETLLITPASFSFSPVQFTAFSLDLDATTMNIRYFGGYSSSSPERATSLGPIVICYPKTQYIST